MGVTPVVGAGSVKYVDVSVTELPNGVHRLGHPVNLIVRKWGSTAYIVSTLPELVCNITPQVLNISGTAEINVKCMYDREIRNLIEYDSSRNALRWKCIKDNSTVFTRYGIKDTTKIVLRVYEYGTSQYSSYKGTIRFEAFFDGSLKATDHASNSSFITMVVENNGFLKDFTVRYYKID